MKNFFLSEILIYSAKERKAKRVKFHPKLTVILGKNDTGKSVLIKSIYPHYWTFLKKGGESPIFVFATT
jgi:predicted ATPase